MSIMISHPNAGSIEEQIALFAQVGFDSFFLSCGVTDDYYKIPEWGTVAEHNGICFEAVHLPSNGLISMWGLDDANAEKAIAEYSKILCFCEKAGVQKAVLHSATNGCLAVTEIGLGRFSVLEQYAKEHGVRLCYENSDTPEHLQALISHADSYHGFCFDTGHKNCYTPDAELLYRYGDRLLITHLHDNDGLHDLHFLPFDGTVNWNKTSEALKECGYCGTLNAELAARMPLYKQMDYSEFVREAYLRLKQLRQLM